MRLLQLVVRRLKQRLRLLLRERLHAMSWWKSWTRCFDLVLGTLPHPLPAAEAVQLLGRTSLVANEWSDCRALKDVMNEDRVARRKERNKKNLA